MSSAPSPDDPRNAGSAERAPDGTPDTPAARPSSPERDVPPRKAPESATMRADKSLALSLRSIYETFAISFPTVIDAARGRVRKSVCDDRLDRWSKAVVKHCGIDVEVTGREHFVPGVTYLVMSNHQSLYDIPVLFYVLGPNVRMVAKKELFRVPIFGAAIKEAGFIELDRGNRSRAIAALEDAKRRLTEGVHVWIAPEGTRSKTGELLPFKKGGFNLALQMGLPILPVTLRGTRDVLEAKGVRSRPNAKVHVTLHRSIDPTPYAKDPATGRSVVPGGRDQLMRDVRAALEEGLG
jgi:1-acyl-sn-glycerol-3-phosphate acyltransferase